MKIKKVVLFVFLVLSEQFYAQEGKIEYHSIFYDRPGVEVDEDFKRKIALEINDMRYTLRYTVKESYFEGLPRVFHDEFMGKIATATAFSDRPWHQYSVEKQAVRNKKIKDSMYIVNHHDRMGEWTMHNETKNLDGYTCYRATMHYVHDYTGNEFTIEAWYTPEIPVPYGPAGYGGLPGLILQLERSHVIFVADKVILNPKDGIKPIKAVKPGRMITLKEKDVLMRRARKVTED